MENRILHLSTWSWGGGAANTVKNLMRYQLEAGLDANLYCGFKSYSDFDSRIFGHLRYFSLFSNFFPFYSQKKGIPLKNFLKREKHFEFSSSLNWSFIDKLQLNLFRSYDLLHLHWVSSGLLSNRVLQKVKMPLVWTLNDMWPMTGGCHYSGNCNKYLQSCGECPVLNSNNAFDISYTNMINRKKALKDKKIVIVGQSTWISNAAKKSSIFENYDIRTIGNIVDTKFFHPIYRRTNHSGRLKIGIGGLDFLKIQRKNSFNIEEIVRQLLINKFQVVLFGSNYRELEQFPYLNEFVQKKSVQFIPKTHDLLKLRDIYRTFDLYIHSAKYENLSNQIMEILSCGIPVIALNIGGNSDLIKSGWNGYLANKSDSNEILTILNRILQSEEYNYLSKNARNFMVQNFSKDRIVAQYTKIYEDLLVVN